MNINFYGFNNPCSEYLETLFIVKTTLNAKLVLYHIAKSR